MEITLDIKEPNDNTNLPHGNIKFKKNGKYACITIDDKTIYLSAKSLADTVNFLYNNE